MPSDRKHADSVLEVCHRCHEHRHPFFSSPFSDQSTTLQVRNTNRDAGNPQEILGRPGLGADSGVVAVGEPTPPAKH